MKAGVAESAFKQVMEADEWNVHWAKSHKVKRGPMWFNITNDLWEAIDLGGVGDDGFWFVQVCQTSGVSVRKHKVKAVPWPKRLLADGSLRVSIAEVRKERNRLDPRRKDTYFRIHDLDHKGEWQVTTQIPCPTTADHSRMARRSRPGGPKVAPPTIVAPFRESEN